MEIEKLPEWARKKIAEHKITHVITTDGKKPVKEASKEEIFEEIMKRDFLRWTARRAGREDLENAVTAGKYTDMEDEFNEILKIAMSRAVREMVSRATFPNEVEVREALEVYTHMLKDPSTAEIIRTAVEEGKISGNVNPRTVELIREGILTGALWAPPHWNVKPNNPVRTR